MPEGCTLHAPILDLNPASYNDYVHEATIKETLWSLDLADRLGARVVTIHPGKRTVHRAPTDEDREKFSISFNMQDESRFLKHSTFTRKQHAWSAKYVFKSWWDQRSVEQIPGLFLPLMWFMPSFNRLKLPDLLSMNWAIRSSTCMLAPLIMENRIILRTARRTWKSYCSPSWLWL